MSHPPMITIELMAPQSLVKNTDEDWTGTTSFAQRRKLQNRLNKRSQYQRKRRQLKLAQQASVSVDTPALSTATEPLLFDDTDVSTATVPFFSKDFGARYSSSAIFHTILQTCEIFETPLTRQKVFALASKAYMDYTMHTPRLSQLPFLITLNINIALTTNASLLGFARGLICLEESISPFSQTGPPSSDISLPRSLAPTEIQSSIVHHPWLDVFPFPRFRDNVIQAVAAGLMDEDELCADVSEINWDNEERPSLIVWGDSSVPDGWEASVLFLRKWGWLLHGCPEVLEATNKWRQSRGENVL